jgi:hypothetical protein
LAWAGRCELLSAHNGYKNITLSIERYSLFLELSNYKATG